MSLTNFQSCVSSKRIVYIMNPFCTPCAAAEALPLSRFTRKKNQSYRFCSRFQSGCRQPGTGQRDLYNPSTRGPDKPLIPQNFDIINVTSFFSPAEITIYHFFAEAIQADMKNLNSTIENMLLAGPKFLLAKLHIFHTHKPSSNV